MHRPSVTSGDAGPPYGGAFVDCLRHSRFPVAASKQDNTPLTPLVNTRPSITVGVERGPLLRSPSPSQKRYGAAYGSDFQISLPAARSRHSTDSSYFWRMKTKTRSPTTTGEE